MVGSFSSNARRSSPGSILHNWLTKQVPHPDSFDCGVRVLAGSIAKEGTRWRYRRAAVDPLRTGGVLTLHHGTKVTLRLILDAEPVDHGARATARPGYVVLSAVERGSGARVQVSVDLGELERFGIEVE